MSQNALLPDQIILKMDAFIEDPCEAPILRKMMLFYLYCFDTEHVFELTASSLPFPRLKCLFRHVTWNPFLLVDCCFPAKRTILTENLKCH